MSTPKTVDKGSDGLPKKLSSEYPSSSKNGESFSVNDPGELLPRFLIIKRIEGDFSTMSPFLIDKVLVGNVGQVNSVRKINDGLLVETKSNNQSRRLLDMKKFHDFEVTITPHSSLNYSKGVITCRDLLNCSITEILENLNEQGVTDVRRITMMRDGKRVESASLILTFKFDKLPKKVKAGFHSITVRPYIPSPLRCFKCLRFGHTSIKCNQNETCVCGKELHPDEPCINPMKCINCLGPHSSRAKDCPKLIEEMAVQKIKTEEKITFAEARRKVKGSVVLNGPSYAKVAAATSQTQASIKDIVKELVPEIVRICTSILKDAMQNQGENTETKRTKEKRPLSSDPPASEEKRKCSEQESRSESENIIDIDQEMYETDESLSQSEFATPRTKHKKPGWPRGRRRKATQ